jgi:ABC-type Fe3+/spermidine/putrescine transport system ATPase subunit
VILLDEPLSALDAKLRLELQVELKGMLKAIGTAAIVVTHDQEEAMSLGDVVVVMNGGRVEQIGSPTDIYARPASRFVAEFVGRSNWFSGQVAAADQGEFCLFETKSDISLRIPKPGPADQSYDVCVRPERIKILEMNAAVPTGWNVHPASIIEALHLGPHLSIVVETAEGRRLFATEPSVGVSHATVGAQVLLAFRPEDCIVVRR